MLAAVLALGASAMWGVGDFLGGFSARRASVFTVLVGSQIVGLLGAAVWLALSGDAWPGLDDALPAFGAGSAGIIGLAALYRGMAVGAMGIVAPISAASPLVPLGLDVAQGHSPAALQWLGIVVVLGGIVVLSRQPGSAPTRGLAAGVALALVAALAFGLYFIGLDAAADGSVPWAVTLARTAAGALVLTAALAGRKTVVPPRKLLPMIAAVGFFDTSANVCVAVASTHSSAGIVAVLSSIYPVVTIALAFALLGERLDRTRRLAGIVALGGAALVAAG